MQTAQGGASVSSAVRGSGRRGKCIPRIIKAGHAIKMGAVVRMHMYMQGFTVCEIQSSREEYIMHNFEHVSIILKIGSIMPKIQSLIKQFYVVISC